MSDIIDMVDFSTLQYNSSNVIILVYLFLWRIDWFNRGWFWTWSTLKRTLDRLRGRQTQCAHIYLAGEIVARRQLTHTKSNCQLDVMLDLFDTTMVRYVQNPLMRRSHSYWPARQVWVAQLAQHIDCDWQRSKRASTETERDAAPVFGIADYRTQTLRTYSHWTYSMTLTTGSNVMIPSYAIHRLVKHNIRMRNAS